MSTSWSGHVVVGIDGSSYSFGAVDWAADWAAMHDLPLGLIAAHDPHVTPSPMIAEDLRRVGLQHAESDLAQARGRAAAAHPDLSVDAELVNLGAAETLIDASEHASLLVIGNRGLGAIRSLFLGGVASQVVTHSACPVVTLPRGAAGPGGDVVVGLDGSDGSVAAAEFAVEHAARSGGKVRAIWVWDVDLRHPGATAGVPALPELTGVEDELRDTLDHWLAPIRARYPQVDVETRIVRGHTPSVLLAAAERAGLLVVGSRGLGGFKRLLLGSTSHAVVRAAECAVAIVR